MTHTLLVAQERVRELCLLNIQTQSAFAQLTPRPQRDTFAINSDSPHVSRILIDTLHTAHSAPNLINTRGDCEMWHIPIQYNNVPTEQIAYLGCTGCTGSASCANQVTAKIFKQRLHRRMTTCCALASPLASLFCQPQIYVTFFHKVAPVKPN